MSQARAEVGFSRDEVADYLCVGLNQVADLETGDASPTALQIAALSRLYRLESCHLTHGRERTESDSSYLALADLLMNSA